MAYNLLGQQGTKGTRNPDPNLTDAEAYYLYDDAPGFKDGKPSKDSDNKGMLYLSGGNEIVDKVTHNKKIQEAKDEGSIDQEVANKIAIDSSFQERLEKVPSPEEKIKEVSNKLTRKERDAITTLADIAKISQTKELDDTDIKILLGKNPEWTRKNIESIIAGTSIPWWSQMGYDSVDEANTAFARDEIDIKEYQKLKNEQNIVDEALNSSINVNAGAEEYTNAYQVNIYKDKIKKTLDVRDPQVQALLNEGWSTEKPDPNAEEAKKIIQSYQVTIYKDGQEKSVDFRTVDDWINNQGWSLEVPSEPSTQGGVSGVSKDKYGYTAEDYKNGIKVYRKDSPNGELVYNFEDLEGVLAAGYGLSNTGIFVFDPTQAGPVSGSSQPAELPQGGIEQAELNNVPNGSYLWEVSGQLYVAYEVPGAGDVYQGAPIFMAYKVANNDLVSSGLITEGGPTPTITQLNEDTFNATTIVFGGDTNQLTAITENPFVGFVESLSDQIQVAPWIADTEMVGLIAEAALEGRTVSNAELQGTNWWRTHSESERDWLVTYNSDPATATQQRTDAQISVANSLQASGVNNTPEAFINWVADQYVSGSWSQQYTSEQIALFADPYATGKRDATMENYLSSNAFTGLDRTTEREREVTELYNRWLGPTLGKLTDSERADIAGKLRDDPDYEDALVSSLKQSRLAAFGNYTNPELTYEDIARPWRNLTTSVWGQTADETQGWWQEMVKSNDFATAQTTLRERGLENNIGQVTQDATKALTQALGQGTISQSGVNV